MLAGGTKTEIEGLENGAFCKPTIPTGVSSEDAICRKEIFGPVLAVMPIGNEADLIARSDACGLAAGILLSDFEKAWGAARWIEAVIVSINPCKQFSVSMPDGMGRKKRIEGLCARQTRKEIQADLTGGVVPWVAP